MMNDQQSNNNKELNNNQSSTSGQAKPNGTIDNEQTEYVTQSNDEINMIMKSFVNGFVKKFEEKISEFIPINTEELGDSANNQLNNIIEALLKLNADELRELLVRVSGYIFYKFQNEIYSCSKDKSKSIEQLAIDSVYRLIKFINESYNIENNHDLNLDRIGSFLTKGIIEGGCESRSLTTIIDENIKITNGVVSNSRNIFEGAKLINKNDNNSRKYQIKKGFELNKSKYGLAFSENHELCNSHTKILNIHEQEEIKELPKEKYVSQLKIILTNINKEDPIKILRDGLNDMKSLINDTLTNVKDELKNVINDKLEQNNIKYRNPVYFDIFPPVKSFTGREEELHQIHKILETKNGRVVISQAVSITGFGGIGKSETSRMYIFKYKKYYNNAIWINSEKEESLKDSFERLSKELGIDTKEKDTKIIAKEIYRYCGMASTIIIFDNAEEFNDIKDILPQSLPFNHQIPSVLITSRSNKWVVDDDEGVINIIELQLFSCDEAIDFIKKSLHEDSNETDMIKLSEQLGYYPLGLKQAISYINAKNKKLFQRKRTRFYIQDYINEFKIEANKIKCLYYKSNNNRYDETVMTTWNLTVQRISKNTDALQIIQIISYLAPDCQDFIKLFNQLIEDEEELWNAIDLLLEYSLININDTTVSIHRLLQLAIRNQLKDNNQEISVLEKTSNILNVYENYLNKTEENSYSTHSQIENLISFYSYAFQYDQLIEKYYKNIHCEHLSILHLLAENGNVDVIKNFIEYIKRHKPLELTGIIDKRDILDYSPVKRAIENGHLNVIKYFNEIGVIFSEEFYKIAVVFFRIDIIKFLNPPYIEYHLFFAYLYNAKKCENLHDLYQYFNELQVNEKENLIQLFCDNKYNYVKSLEYIFESSLVMKFFIENKFHIDSDKTLKLLIKYSIYYNHSLDIYKELVDKSKDLNTFYMNNYNATILLYATGYGKLELVQYLIANGANINVCDKNDKTILHFAASNEQLNIIQYLLESEFSQRLDINATNLWGETPIYIALFYRRIKHVEFLLNKKRDLNIKTNFTYCSEQFPDTTFKLLHVAIAVSDLSIVKLIIKDEGLSVIEDNIVNDINVTALHIAILFNSIDIIQYFIELDKLFKAKINLIEIQFTEKNILRKKYNFYNNNCFKTKFYNRVCEFLHKNLNGSPF